MGTTPTGPAVAAPGAACRLRPSPTALAVRLEGLRARDLLSLDALVAKLPEPPWDAEVAADDPLVSLLTARSFEPYATGAVLARPVQGVPAPRPPQGVEIVDYTNDRGAEFTAAEALAMEGTAAFRELGSPSGYEWGEGHGAFVVARRRGEIVGFAHADLPDGWIDWLGVIPDARGTGVGRALVGAVAQRVQAAQGTHLVAFAEDGGAAGAFLQRLGFTPRGRRTLLIRRS